MKTRCLTLVVAVSSAIAATNSRELAFASTAFPLPPLTLSGAPLTALAPSANPAMQFPTAPTDLIAPASTRTWVVQDFHARRRTQALSDGPDVRRKPTIAYPFSPTDLIGRSADREKLIADFKSRNQADR